MDAWPGWRPAPACTPWLGPAPQVLYRAAKARLPLPPSPTHPPRLSPPPGPAPQVLYRAAKARFDEEEDFKTRAREAVTQLQGGNPEYHQVRQYQGTAGRPLRTQSHPCLPLRLHWLPSCPPAVRGCLCCLPANDCWEAKHMQRSLSSCRQRPP